MRGELVHRSGVPRTLSDVRRLELRLALLFGLTWVSLCLALGLVTTVTEVRGEYMRLDEELGLVAMATYGLAYYDERDVFHDEFLQSEKGSLPLSAEVWIVAPGRTDSVPLAPPHPRCDLLATFRSAAPLVVAQEIVDFQTVRDAAGRECRVRRMRTYADSVRTPIAAIFVAAPTEPTHGAVRIFLVKLWGALLCACAIGVVLAIRLSRLATRPFVDLMAEREHFLRAAAHELKTPLSRVRLLAEGAGSSVPDRFTQPLLAIVEDGTRAAAALLRSAEFAYLEQPKRIPFRLDLATEAVAPEGVVSAAPVVVLGDPDWLRIAIENLLLNAEEHGGGVHAVRVDERGVFVEDNGPGFAEAALLSPVAPFRRGPTSRGTGLGLSLASEIAASHGGSLIRQNRPGGGALVALVLPTRKPC